MIRIKLNLGVNMFRVSVIILVICLGISNLFADDTSIADTRGLADNVTEVP